MRSNSYYACVAHPLIQKELAALKQQIKDFEATVTSQAQLRESIQKARALACDTLAYQKYEASHQTPVSASLAREAAATQEGLIMAYDNVLDLLGPSPQ